MSFLIHEGDALAVLRTLPEASVNCCVTSPPYFGLRDYGMPGQIGLETSPAEYVCHLVEIFEEVRRVLRDDGTLWLNLGDSYANDGKWGGHTGGKHASVLHASPIGRNKRYTGLKPKDLIGIPWRMAFALQDAGWWLRCDIIWNKPNPMPESVRDRPTKSHEYVFLLTKSQKYFYDADAIKEPGVYAGPNGRSKSPHAQGFARRDKVEERVRQDKQRGHGRRHAGFNERWDKMTTEEQCAVMRNKRSVWTLAAFPTPEAHFATFPLELPEICLKAGCPAGGIVLDPFAGAGTTGLACLKNDRQFIGIELNPEYIEIAHGRTRKYYPLLLNSGDPSTAQASLSSSRRTANEEEENGTDLRSKEDSLA